MDELVLRARFAKKFDESIGRPIKSWDEYLKQAKEEIDEQNNSLNKFLQSLEIKPN